MIKTDISVHLAPLSQGLAGYFRDSGFDQIRCGNRENDKYIAGIRDLTVSREAARYAGFMFAYLSGMPETFTTHRF